MMKPTRVTFYGNFGAGNLGNECTLQTAIEQTLSRMPDAQLLCVCPNPDDVRSRHGIAAAPSLSKDPEWTWFDLSVKSSGEQGDDAARSPVQRTRGLHRLAARLSRFCRIALLRAPQELGHWYKTLHLMARTDVFVVPGTGIVTDASCGSLGWPYDMFKLCVAARLCGVRVIFLSVGAGPFRYRLGCWLITQSLGLAHYRSYRDVDSKRRLQAIGFNRARDEVYPDLVFGLSRSHLGAEPTCTQRRRIVGLGLKDYATPVHESDKKSYRAYLDAMAAFVVWLQARGDSVRLLIGDAQYDTRVREDLIAVLKARGSAGNELVSDPVPTVEELLRQLRETDAVVSPRFHNLVLALMLNKPVIALSDLPKIDALLGDLDLGAYCLSLEGLRTEELTARFVRLENEADSVRSHIRTQVERYRRLLDEQYSMVFGNRASSSSLLEKA